MGNGRTGSLTMHLKHVKERLLVKLKTQSGSILCNDFVFISYCCYLGLGINSRAMLHISLHLDTVARVAIAMIIMITI